MSRLQTNPLYVNRVVGVRSGLLLSIFLSCILCDRLTREKCGDKIFPFKCVHCKAVAQDVLSTRDLNETVELNDDVVMACYDDIINQLPLYFCVFVGKLF